MPLRYVDPARPTTALSRALTGFGRSSVGQFFAKNVAARTDIWLGQVSNGRVNWGMLAAPSATLTAKGAKSSQPRQAQISYFHDGGRDVIAIASNFGGGRHPAWYHNLVAHAECELGGEPFHATEVTDPAEYARLYGLAEQAYAGYADYRAKAARRGRHIPVLRLTPEPARY